MLGRVQRGDDGLKEVFSGILLLKRIRYTIPLHATPNMLPDTYDAESEHDTDEEDITIHLDSAPDVWRQEQKLTSALQVKLHLLGTTFKLSPEDFESKTGFIKPEKDSPIVTMCFVGIRSQTAQLALMGAGYTNVRNYFGSFRDWHAKGGEIQLVQQKRDKEEEL
ncbi:unnamed protein product, partial [Meganyctiphanes norvegica]